MQLLCSLIPLGAQCCGIEIYDHEHLNSVLSVALRPLAVITPMTAGSNYGIQTVWESSLYLYL